MTIRASVTTVPMGKVATMAQNLVVRGALERSATRLQGTFVTFERYIIFKLQDVT